MLYGMSLIYGLTARRDWTRSREGFTNIDAAKETLAFSAILFVVIGFAFKVSAVPFQFWAPDTYEGAPVRWRRSSRSRRAPPGSRGCCS